MAARKERQNPRMLSSFSRVLTAALFVFVSCQDLSAATTYFVDSASPAGDGGDGTTEDKAWNSLQQVNASMGSFVAGDQILFKRGSTFSAMYPNGLDIAVSGEVGNPLVFGAYGLSSDPKPILDGSKPLSGPWTEVPSAIGIWSHAYPLSDPANHLPRVLHYNDVSMPPITTLQFDSVPATLLPYALLLNTTGGFSTLWATSVDSGASTVSGITFAYNLSKLTDGVVRAMQLDADDRMRDIPESPLSIPTVKENYPAGLTEPGHWYWYDNRIYLRSTVEPTGSMVQIGEVGIYEPPAAQEIRFPCVRIMSSAYVEISDLKIRKCNENGIFIGDNSSNITVTGMDIAGCGSDGIKLYNSSDNTIRDNTLDSTGGILLWALPGETRFSQNNDILNNTISHCRGAGIALLAEANGDPRHVSGNRFVGNHINHSNTMMYDSAGIYTLFAGANTIESNVIENGGSKYMKSAGIMIDVSGGATTIKKNTIVNNSLGGIAVTGDGHQITDNILRNNGALSWRPAQLIFFSALGNPARNCRVTGNTVEANQDQHFIDGAPGSQSGHVIENNIYTSLSTKLFSWTSDWSGSWMDFKTWRRKTGHDCESTLNSVSYSLDSCSSSLLPHLFLPAVLVGGAKGKE